MSTTYDDQYAKSAKSQTGPESRFAALQGRTRDGPGTDTAPSLYNCLMVYIFGKDT